MQITVIGTGYVGLVSGSCLAEKGHHVTCIDIDKNKIKNLNLGNCPIYEDGLPAILEKNIGNRLFFSDDLEESINKSSVVIICVGTPFDGEKIDLSYLEKASSQIGKIINNIPERKTIIVKSTVIPGTTETFVSNVIESHSGKKVSIDFGLGMNPEFLREGSAVQDFMNPDRIVLGGTDPKTIDVMKEIYLPFVGTDIIETNCTTAELIKYLSNSYLATLISFSNEIANFCTSYKNVDAIEVFDGLHKDRRLSPIINGNRISPDINTYLKPGCGFGGSCFPKDVKSLISEAKTRDVSMPLLNSVIDINEAQPKKMLELLLDNLTSLKDRKIGILGLAFKPGTDDLRESPSLKVIDFLLKEKVKILAHDPIANKVAKKQINNENINFYDDIEEVLSDSEAVLVMTAWDEYKDIHKIIDKLNNNIFVIDGRRILDKDNFQNYSGIGLS
tara:strand:+ start:275 stop:1612 length:1338 start_codon:yes stop_codon:yes gene_type:complete